VVSTSFSPDSLVATWLGSGEGVGLWLSTPGSHPDLVRLTKRCLGAEAAQHAPDRATSRTFAEWTRDQWPNAEVATLDLPLSIALEALLERSNDGSSPTLTWFAHLAESADALVSAGRPHPSLTTSGLRWTASWDFVPDSSTDRMIDALTETAPPAVFALHAGPMRPHVSSILRDAVDAIARSNIQSAEWRPPLPPSRASAVVALRRFAQALTGADSVFIGDSTAHEQALSEWSTALAELGAHRAGAPTVSFHARLEPPTSSSDNWWSLTFEVLPPDGDPIPFRDVWSGSEEAISAFEGAALEPLRSRMRSVVDQLSAQLALFAGLAGEESPASLALDSVEVSELLDDGLDVCRRAGLPVLTPASLVTQSARLTAQASPIESRGALGSMLVSVDWGVALGELQLTEAELIELAESKADVVALRGAWVQIDRSQIGRIMDAHTDKRRTAGELTPAELLRESVTALTRDGEDLSAEGWIARLLDGLPDDQLTEATEPAGFNGELRPYQRRALGWLQFLGRLGLGGCLADDMGLGKTPTALAHMLDRTLTRLHHDEPARPHLVVCPLSVVSNWKAEAERFTPELRVFIAHGTDRPAGQKLVDAVESHDITITTYGTASRVVDELKDVQFDVLVLDEAQAVKTHTTTAAKTVRAFRSTQAVALTGTPVENRLTELWSILDALNPGMLGGITWFRRTFSAPIEAEDDPDARAALKRITSPFVLRRTKADRSLVPDLPDKIETVEHTTLTREQAGLYQAIVDEFVEAVATRSGMERRGLVLATLTRLKQVCNHPAHFLREDDVGDPARSGKLDRFDELIDAILEADERVLVFSQYREMGKLLRTHLQSRLGLDVNFLHGGSTRTQRERMVEDFQSGHGPPIQLISLRAGGTGLNLTAASRVIHYDRWWNPAVEDQATDRTWRIGQDRTVFVHKLVCQGTLEERIDALLTEKRRLAESVVGSDDSWMTELSTDELRELVRLDVSAHQDTEPAW